MNALTAIQLTNALVTLSINALVAVQKYQSVILKARTEGRDVSAEELAEFKTESHRITEETRAILEGLKGE